MAINLFRVSTAYCKQHCFLQSTGLFNTVRNHNFKFSQENCQRSFKQRQLSTFRSLKAASNQTATEAEQELIISPACVAKLKEITEAEKNLFLRIVVEGGGCSGFQYKFDLDSTLNDDDRVFIKDEVKVVIDDLSLDYIKGSTVDYHTELIRAAFRITSNPLADKGCSCGASFSIKI